MIRRNFLGATLLVVALGGGCGESGDTANGPGVVAKFVVPESLEALDGATFYDHPFPSDLRRDPDGSVHYAGFYSPFKLILVDAYVKATKGLLPGFSPAAAGYVRFEGSLDPASLPADPPASRDAGATAFLMDVDPASPERGKRRMIQLKWQEEEGVYWLPRTLGFAPATGYPLAPKTRYAFVVTRRARGAGGAKVSPSRELEEVLGLSPATARTQALAAQWRPAIEELGKAGVPAGDVAHLTVFTTNDPTAELLVVADHAKKEVPAPTATGWTARENKADYDVYEGSYGPVPSYQDGKLPFSQIADGGGFKLDAGGKPVVAGTFSMRFSMVVPKEAACPEPAAGYPIALYAHGTGGDYRSVVDEGGSVGRELAKKCIASMGVDQIFHGARPGAPPDSDPNKEGNIQLLFFNLNNPVAARTNNRQSAIDVVMQARLFEGGKTTVPAATSRSGKEVHFDPSRLLFVGHSQGGLNGPLFLAIDDAARGGVLSGSGAFIAVSLLEKTKPQPSVAGAVATLLGLNAETKKELDLFHPAMGLVQALIDVTDPLHYARFTIKSPRPGFAPKSVLMTEGIDGAGVGDSYTPPPSIEAGAVALGLPRLAPGTRPIAAAAWSGLGDLTVPAGGTSGNLADGRASGAIAQFAPAGKSDGHFVLFDVPEARELAAQFCRNLADDPKGKIPAL